MSVSRTRVIARWIPVLAGVAFLAGCLGEKVVYRDRELFQTPPSGAANFLGYSDVSAKLTVCGNCHVEKQHEWEGTVHATAWEDLQASGHATSTCEACHTVNEQGNPTEGNAGFLAVADERYKDVQCESCHGPGLNHVQNPTTTTVPLAPLAVGIDLTKGCGECHQGEHHPFVEEWAQSAHGAVPNQGHTGDNPSCQGCHTGEGALAAWGINANFLEKDELGTGNHLPIACGVCHDPHEKNFEGQLRFDVGATSEEENLCMKCHHKRGVPDPTTFRGPHSPEGPVLLGYGGWWPGNVEFAADTIVATHGSSANPRLCASCHVNQYSATDPATGTTIFSTGHLFNAIPCLGPDGAPTLGDCETSQRTFKACTASGCHGTEQVARSLLATTEVRIESLTDELNGLLEKVQPNWKACRGANNCPAGSPFNGSDGTYSTAEGAAFNYDLNTGIYFPGSAVHNPFLMEALLTASIKAVEKEYGVAPSANIVLDNILPKQK